MECFLVFFNCSRNLTPFLAQHITELANRGAGHTSYLSKTIYEVLIILIAKKTPISNCRGDQNCRVFFGVS